MNEKWTRRLKFVFGALAGLLFSFMTIYWFTYMSPATFWFIAIVIMAVTGVKWMEKGAGSAFKFLLILFLIEGAYLLLLLSTCSFSGFYS